MKLLLDENLPHELRPLIIGHTVYTAAFMQWNGMRNGILLASAGAEHFDALITMDTGIKFQQNNAALPCAVVVLRAKSNTMREIQPLIPLLLARLQMPLGNSVIYVG